MALVLAERFEVLEQVGSGGFGAVYQARDLYEGQHVAVKLLHRRDTLDEGRFQREATLLSGLRHPSIVRYISHGTATSGHPFLVMEWLEGHSLSARLKQGWLSVEDTLTVALRIVDGLAFAASKGVVHRDVKPGNIFLPAGRIGDTKLLDFGLARRVEEGNSLTRSGVLLGTPLYMSPEQARGMRTAEPSSDIFSLGSLLFECLCGVSPFESATALGTLAKICFEPPPHMENLRTNLPTDLVRLVAEMLQKSPDQRPNYNRLATDLVGVRRQREEGPVASISINLPTMELVASAAVPSLRPRAQQRVVSAVFAGQTETYSEQQLTQMLDVLLDRHGARCERLVDGSIILLLERQTTPHEQAIAAAHCAIALRELLPDAPIVICTTRTVVEAGVPMGTLLENGSRLLAQTPEGMVRLDEASAALLEARFDLRGPEGRRILERERIDGEGQRTLLGRVTPFVGRQRELGQIDLLFRECVDDEVARAALVTAPAGAGKSRLRFELLQRLRREEADVTLLIGSGDAVRMGAPFSTLAPAIRALVGIRPADDLETRRRKLQERVATAVGGTTSGTVAAFLGEMLGLDFSAAPNSELDLARRDPRLRSERIQASWLQWMEGECKQRPVVILMDDLHWADQTSVQFLEASLRHGQQSAFLLVALARPEVRDRFPNLFEGREVVEIPLSKLASRACEKLLQALPEAALSPQQAQWLIERADGNPFFLEELIRSVCAGDQRGMMPDSVLATIQARLDALGEDAKLLLRIASVFGQEFRADGVHALLGPHADRFDLSGWLKVLAEKELIFARPGGDGADYGFRHALVRDAAYALLTDDARDLSHRLAGEWLEAQGAVEPAVLAEHFERGKALQAAARAYAQATAKAHEVQAFGDVVRLGERAAACATDGRLIGEVGSLVAEAFSYQGKQREAQEWAERSKALLAVGTKGWWRACQVLASALFIQESLDQAETVSYELLTAPHDENVQEERIFALCVVGNNALGGGRSELGTRLLAATSDAMDRELLPRVRGIIEEVQVYLAIDRGDLGAVFRSQRSALANYQRSGGVADAQNATGNMGVVLIFVGALEEAERLLQEGLNSHDVIHRAFCQQNLGLLALRRGDPARACNFLEESIRAFAGTDSARLRATSMSYLARAKLQLNDLNAAEGHCIEALATSGIPDVRSYALGVKAQVHLALGNHDEGLALTTQALDGLQGCARMEDYAIITSTRVECLLALGREREADQELRTLHEWLSARLASLDDPEMRRRYIQNVPDNRRALELVQTRLGLTFELD